MFFSLVFEGTKVQKNIHNSTKISNFAPKKDFIMKIYTQQKELKSLISDYKKQGKTIGFVPTMGALHEGHLSLINRALQENDIAVVSIFVNPTQFNNPADLEKYPRTLEADAKKIATLSKNILIYAPTVEDIYGENVSAEHFDFGTLDKVMEGPSRPGHFEGVGTVVKKLFEIVTPNKAYFGEKDYQQLLIIKMMVTQKRLPVEVIGCSIVRNEEGLALSSRNQLLSEDMKHKATFIYKTLTSAKKRFQSPTATEVIAWVEGQFDAHPDFTLEYFTINDADTLQPITEKKKAKHYRAFIVVYAEGVRLIDNIAL